MVASKLLYSIVRVQPGMILSEYQWTATWRPLDPSTKLLKIRRLQAAQYSPDTCFIRRIPKWPCMSVEFPVVNEYRETSLCSTRCWLLFSWLPGFQPREHFQTLVNWRKGEIKWDEEKKTNKKREAFGQRERIEGWSKGEKEATKGSWRARGGYDHRFLDRCYAPSTGKNLPLDDPLWLYAVTRKMLLGEFVIKIYTGCVWKNWGKVAKVENHRNIEKRSNYLDWDDECSLAGFWVQTNNGFN